ncbi:MAG: hypothetical protein ACYC64_18255 [Armatimonadota bacterium]
MLIDLCTYFDVNYMSRALAMYESVERFHPNFRLFMLCFDQESFERLSAMKLPRAVPISIEEFEASEPEVAAVKPTRSRLEYFYTCGPALPMYVLKHNPDVNLITYVDADMFFYADPQCLIDEMGDCSVAITAHHFPEYRKSEPNGIYNVAWLSFRRDDNGMACLSWWRERCIEWCYERYEDDKYADQKYLDRWPELFQGVKVLENRGANVAPWNVTDYNLTEKDGKALVDGWPLVFFHFHGFKKLSDHVYNTNLGTTFRTPSPVLKKHVFPAYIKALNHNAVEGRVTGSIRKKNIRAAWIQSIRNLAKRCIGVVFRQYIFVIGENVY